jgi:hypothetical protein
VSGGDAHHHDHGQHRDGERDQQAGGAGGLGDAEEVDRGERDDRRDADRAGGRWRGVQAHGQRHRRAAGRLADHEPPAGEVPGELAEPLPPVHVGAAGLGVAGGQPGRAVRVAERDQAGYRERDQQPDPTSGGGGRREHHEHAGAEHRAEADDHGVAQAEAAIEAGGHPPTLRSAG